MGSSPAILQLPDELLDLIICQLATAADTVHFGKTCKRAHTLGNASLVWRRLCLTTWRYWLPRHDLPRKLAQRPLHTDWLQLYSDRVQTDRAAAGLFDELLLAQQNRVQRMQEIAARGKDVQDLLLKFKDETPDEAADVLARRWHAEAILGMIHRSTGLDIWRRVALDEDVSLEEALCGFDMFHLAIDRTDLIEDVKTELDRIATCVRDRIVDFDALSIRQKAVGIAEYLMSEGLVGALNSRNYHALGNNFLSIALFGEPRTTLPLQSVAIFCGVARRLGLDARPSNLPGHVTAVVTAPPGQRLDGGSESTGGGPDRMHMDPGSRSQEIPRDQVEQKLIRAGIPPHRYADFLGAADTLDMCTNTANSLLRSIETAHVNPPTTLDSVAAQYGAGWAVFMLGDTNPGLATVRRQHVNHFLLEQVRTNFPEDSALLAMNVLPMLENEADYDLTSAAIGYLREKDQAQRTQKPRGPETASVRFQIGHYFQHKRYGYRGFIVGWDVHCAAGLHWILTMGVDELPRGRMQPFYKIREEDKSSRYVAEENIILLSERPERQLLRLGGRFFKRWDEDEKRFVNNIREKYPDN